MQREDDTEGVIRSRLEVYRQQTEPAAMLYRDRGTLKEIDASGDPDGVFSAVRRQLGNQ